MSSLVQGDYDIHPTRRITEIGIGQSPNSSYFSAIGDDCFDGIFDGRTGTFSYIVDDNGARVQITTAPTTGDYNHIFGSAIYRRNHEPSFYARLRFPTTSLSNLRCFVGLTNLDPDTMTAGDSPVGIYCGFWKDNSSSQLRFIRNNNSTPSKQNIIGIDTNVHDVYMWLKKSGGADVVIFQLDNGTRYSVNLNIPATTQNLKYMAVIRTLTNIARTIEIGKIHIDSLY